MTEKIKNILRGAGSVISVNGAMTLRSSSSVRVAGEANEGLNGDFRRISNDLTRCIDKATSKKLAHG